MQSQINNKYAVLSEALYISERTAREEVKARASIKKIDPPEKRLDTEQSEIDKSREERARERQRELRLEAVAKKVHVNMHKPTS